MPDGAQSQNVYPALEPAILSCGATHLMMVPALSAVWLSLWRLACYCRIHNRWHPAYSAVAHRLATAPGVCLRCTQLMAAPVTRSAHRHFPGQLPADSLRPVAAPTLLGPPLPGQQRRLR